MTTRKLGPFTVGAIGLGCMNICHAYGEPSTVAEAERLIAEAVDIGVTHFDTAALYGFGASEEIVGRVLKPHRDRIMLASKGGMAGVKGADNVMRRVINGRPDALRRNVEDSLRRLGTDVIDLYYLHRWDKSVPIEESIGALGDLVRKGDLRTLGVSEVSAATLRKAHKEHPITAIQTEYSLWVRNPEIAVLDACRELDIAFVAFSPVARGFLAGSVTDLAGLPAKDIRHTMPRFQPENFERNVKLVPAFAEIAADAGCTPAQFALAWVLQKAPFIHAIPGTRSPAHLAENMEAAGIRLTAAEIARAEDLINARSVIGNRYGAQARAEVDTEEFPDA